MAKGKAQRRRVNRLGKLGKQFQNQLTDSANQGLTSYLSAIQPEFDQLQGLATMFRNQMNTPFSQTTQGMSLLNTIENQSTQASERLDNSASLLGLSDESVLAGKQNIAKSEADKMINFQNIGFQAQRNAQQGYGNIISNLLGQRAKGFNTGLSMGQFGIAQGRDVQKQAGEQIGGIADTLIGGFSSAVPLFLDS